MSHLFGFIVWNVDPDFIHRGAIVITWFGFLYAVAFYMGYKNLSRIFKTEKLAHKQAERLVIYLIIGIFVFSRLGKMLVFDSRPFLEHPSDILKFWQGHLFSYFSALGILVALFFYIRQGFSKSYTWILDRLVIALCLSGFFIRLGNLLNSEFYGIETNVPWGFKFISDPVNKGFAMNVIKPHHPIQIYEAVLFLTVYLSLYSLYFRKRDSIKPGTLTGLALVCNYGVLFFIDFLKNDKTAAGKFLLSHIHLNLDQTIAIFLVVSGIALLLIPAKYLEKKKTVKRVDKKVAVSQRSPGLLSRK